MLALDGEYVVVGVFDLFIIEPRSDLYDVTLVHEDSGMPSVPSDLK